ncbi:hypothetical protein DFQ28_005269 [Apophysomyces sp. BC1034]|nr:hypothetical protein DFQ30_003434 [Apophysomyces sp. BC1015]KAG0182805.1 hypothetical protein DFQ29_001970 [Apophysomyces sp. BC1021]KAG0193451.1 hypothetical protein DFQ28_005269 [Apophysomyces sp. BC1034]
MADIPSNDNHANTHSFLITQTSRFHTTLSSSSAATQATATPNFPHYLHSRRTYTTSIPTLQLPSSSPTENAATPTTTISNSNTFPDLSLHGTTVGNWAGPKKRIRTLKKRHGDIRHRQEEDQEDDSSWRDVYRNIKCMDQLYDATFYSWLKSEDNVFVTAMYLQRIANEYPLIRIINALKWLISDWRLESISTLVRHVTVDWCDEVGDLRRAHLLRHLTHSWATQYTTTLLTMVLSTPPYVSSSTFQRERFLRAFTQNWDFSKLSEFFMYLQSPANIDYKVKCLMLQEAARRERETLGAKLNRKKRSMASGGAEEDAQLTGSSRMRSDENGSTTKVSKTADQNTTSPDNPSSPPASSSSGNTLRRHHRRTSSNDVNDIKRLRLSTPEIGSETQSDGASPASLSPPPNFTGCMSPGPSPSNSVATASATTSHLPNTNNRRSATPDHHHLRCVTSTTSSTSLQLRNSTSSSSNNNNSTNGVTNTVNSELSHLHLNSMLNPSTSNSQMTTSGHSQAQPSSDVANAFNSRHHASCYPYNASSNSLQIHNLQLRRRSSSTSSTSSNWSTGSSGQQQENEEESTSSSVKKRSAPSNECEQYGTLY